MYDGKSELEYHMQPLYGSFTLRQEVFDNVIKKEQSRQKMFTSCFNITNLIVAMFILIWVYTSQNSAFNEGDQEELTRQYWKLSTFGILCGFILAGSAVYLTKTLRDLTGQKTNSCLVVWHITNLLLMATLDCLGFIFRDRWTAIKKKDPSNCQEIQQLVVKYQYIWVFGVVTLMRTYM